MKAHLFKRSAHLWIARHRQSALVRRLHSAAGFVERAYDNDSAGFGEFGERSLLCRLSKARFQTVFDVGANIGDWTEQALRVWPKAKIHAFEISPQTAQRLKSRFRDRANVVVNDIGLSDEVGERQMFHYPDSPDITCDRPRHPGRVEPFTGHFSKGDVYCRTNDIHEIDFIKIDVEGSEHLVMKGLGELVHGGRVSCLQFEYGAFSIDSRFLLADYYELLRDQYWIGKIFPETVEFQAYSWTAESFRFSNYLCISKNREDLRALAAGK